MKVVILCGGMGTRFREETRDKPKPMIEIGGRPMLWHVMRIYAHYGFKEFVLALGYRGDVIKDYFLNYHYLSSDFTLDLSNASDITFHESDQEVDWKVTLADTGLSTMTGGRIRRVQRYIGDETFMVTYGDGLADINIKDLQAFHYRSKCIGTVTGVQMPSNFGLIDVDSEGIATRFREKPMLDGWVNGGFFVFEPAFFDYLTGDDCILEREPLQRLARESQVAVYRHSGYWQCMDHYGDYARLNEAATNEHAPWAVWERT